MSVRLRLVRHQVALGTVCSLMLAPVAPLIAAPSPAAVKPSPPIDGGWPKSYVTPTGASVTLYQPQVADVERPEAAHAVRGGCLYAVRRHEAGARHRHGRGPNQGVGQRSPGRFLGIHDHRFEFPDPR